jgi:hypothetical protein
MFGFVTLHHASRDQKAYAKSGKEKEKIFKKCMAYHRA